MKIKIFSMIAILATCSFCLQAQVNVTEMNIHGLKVIFKPSAKQSVSAYMFFKGGTANYSAQQQGIESLALSAATECGTQKYPKDAFKDLADKYSIDANGGSNYDYGFISMSCVKPYFDKGWDLFAEAINHPVFDVKELSMLQQKKISGLKSQESDPDNSLTQMTMQDAFKGTRYAIRPEGSIETMSAFKQEEIKKYYDDLLNVNRLLLVIVGNLSIQDVKQKVEIAFGTLPSAPLAQVKVPESTIINATTLNVENRKLATNYMSGILGAPSPTSSEFNAYRLAFAILNDKLFEEVRTKRNLSYTPAATLSSGFLPFAEVYVTTTKPREAVNVIVDEIKRLRNGGFTATDLKDAKSKLMTSYFMRNESTSANARALGIAEIKGSWKNEISLLNQINAVTLPEMQNTFAKYIDGIKWSYLGDETLTDKEAFGRTTK
ncbi:MAG: insulinase family protein [Bacteroidetes bacterium]|nr:insulinase family protein [Bacteroidota bacterium]